MLCLKCHSKNSSTKVQGKYCHLCMKYNFYYKSEIKTLFLFLNNLKTKITAKVFSHFCAFWILATMLFYIVDADKTLKNKNNNWIYSLPSSSSFKSSLERINSDNEKKHPFNEQIIKLRKRRKINKNKLKIIISEEENNKENSSFILKIHKSRHRKHQNQNITTINEYPQNFTEKIYLISEEYPIHILFPLPTNDGRKNENPFGITILKAKPVVDEAVEDVYRRQLVPQNSLQIHFEDSKLSDAHGPNVAINQLVNNTLDCIIGYAFVYALAPVARMSPYWRDKDSFGIPVITSVGLTSNLDNRREYQLMTRISSPYKVVKNAVIALFSVMGWIRSSYLFHEQRHDAANPSIPYGECYLLMASIQPHLYRINRMEHNYFMFNELNYNHERIKENLRKASIISNVIILCASPDTVREIMLAAYELGMATSGEYVFINIDVSTGSHAEKPWLRQNDSSGSVEENEKAKQAYRALKTISLRRSDLEEYKNFEARVKERAEKKYNYSKNTGKEYEMNNFISAFYDAVLLYAIALNETLSEGLDPRNGRNITSKMWNRTFVGITGNVSIDHNGDRYSDYSLLDLDPEQGKFVEVAYYSGASNELKEITDFHWVGGKPPKDFPVCGWDRSKCPEGYPAHVYALMGLGIVVIILLIGFAIFYRRYRAEAELAKMTWKIKWEELDGEDIGKDKRKKRLNVVGCSSGNKVKPDLLEQSEALLLRSNSRASIGSDKRSSSSGATRKISAMLDRKISIFTRKKSSPTDNQQQQQQHKQSHSQSAGKTTTSTLTNTDQQQPQQITNHIERNAFSSPTFSIGNNSNNDKKRKKKSNQWNDEVEEFGGGGLEEEDLELGSNSGAGKKSIVSCSTNKNNRKFSFSVYSIKSGGSVETIQLQNNAQIFTKTAMYKGTMVAIKMLNLDPKKYPKLELPRSLLIQLKEMKDLQHDHLTRFCGACVDAPNYCIVTEYCPKGSLEDILENEKIKLDKMMKYSLLHDLVKGMHYLHGSLIRTHGRLKTSNCVVDSRFVLKVTDFGLAELHAMEDIKEDELESHAYFRKKLWTAPELLRETNSPVQGTQKGDVYSFALILHEMLFRKGAFYLGEDECVSPKEILSKLVQPVDPHSDIELYRPLIPQDCQPVDDTPETVKKLIELMMACWSESPSGRPDFSTIRKVVHTLNKENETSNLVDNLLKRMEQYATNLEGLVEERTQEYLGEKKKVEELLHQLLPPSIADQLIAGNPVQAEAYDSVTIYFSDIVGFTALSALSTPMQVVALLNDLYLAFDSVVDNFKVYKVETIGDAYMVVSGLPEKRDDHASQIAQMSLALLHKVKNFTIKHRPNEQLKLRIGIHSGSVVAGVVGSKMPRYCLFGDTVNTSSRMESNGLPLRIHVSSDTRDILVKDSDFQLELRGEVEMKGKGKQTTYWLKGYKDTHVPYFGPEYL